jgi:hypothetical protein
VNPFSEAFKKVDAAVAEKQAYEQKEIQQIFHALLDGKFKTERKSRTRKSRTLRAPDRRRRAGSRGDHQGHGSEARAAGRSGEGGVCAGDAYDQDSWRSDGKGFTQNGDKVNG